MHILLIGGSLVLEMRQVRSFGAALWLLLNETGRKITVDKTANSVMIYRTQIDEEGFLCKCDSLVAVLSPFN